MAAEAAVPFTTSFAGGVPAYPSSVCGSDHAKRSILILEKRDDSLLGKIVGRRMPEATLVNSNGMKREFKKAPTTIQRPGLITVVNLQDNTVYNSVIKMVRFADEHLEESAKASMPNIGYVAQTFYATTDIASVAANVELVLRPTKAHFAIQSAMKYTSVASFFTGILCIMDTLKELKRAQKVGHVAGRRILKIRLARGIVETSGGIVMGAVRTIGIMAARSTAKAIIVWNTVAGIASTVSGSVLYTLLAIPFAIDGIRSHNVLRDLNNTSSSYEGINYLKGLLELTDEDIEDVKREIESESLTEMAKALKETSEEGKRILTTLDRAKVSSAASQLHLGGIPQELIYARLEKGCADKKLAKEDDYRRKMGNDSLLKLKRGEDNQEIVELAKSEAHFKTALFGFLVVTCLLGIVSFITATVAATPATLMAGLVLMLIMNVMMISADTFGLAQEAKSLVESGWRDKALLAVLSVLILGATGLGAYFAEGTVVMGVILLSGFLMMLMQGGAMAYSFYRHKSEWEEENR